MGVLDDATLDQDFEKLREESQAVSPQPSTEPVPAQPQVPPSQENGEDTQPDKSHWVPLPTFLEEKKERQRLEQIQREMAERQARLDERHRMIEEKLKPQADPPPDPNQDPIGFIQHSQNQNSQTLNDFQAKLQAWEQQQAQRQQVEAISLHVAQAEDAFSKQQQDYYDAVNHIREVRMAQYELAGLDQQQQMQALAADTRNWAMALLQSGRNPAEATYELAKKYGYVAGGNTAARPQGDDPVRATQDVATPTPGQQQFRNPDGTFAKSPPNPKAEANKETLKTVARGQSASKSISGPGAADDGIPSPDELATMSEEDFDKWTSGKNWKKYWLQDH